MTVLCALVVGFGALVGCGGGSSDESDDAAATTIPTEESPEESSTTTAADDSSNSDGESNDTCDLFSDEVAAQVLGVDIVRREPVGDPGDAAFGCVKGAEEVDISQATSVSVSVRADAAVEVETLVGRGDNQPVDGLGDGAVYTPEAGAIAIAFGSDLISVRVLKAGLPGSQQDVVAVANDVLDRLY